MSTTRLIAALGALAALAGCSDDSSSGDAGAGDGPQQSSLHGVSLAASEPNANFHGGCSGDPFHQTYNDAGVPHDTGPLRDCTGFSFVLTVKSAAAVARQLAASSLRVLSASSREELATITVEKATLSDSSTFDGTVPPDSSFTVRYELSIPASASGEMVLEISFTVDGDPITLLSPAFHEYWPA